MDVKKALEMKQGKRANGAACVLAIGKATPPNIITQKDYPDYYFSVTNSEHKVELKEKFRRICEQTRIKKRHHFLTKDILMENPNMLTYGAPSLDARRALTIEYIPKLCTKAAVKALSEWGKPKSDITHLLVYTTLAFGMSGLDCELIKHLELDANVQHSSFSSIGCHAGIHLLRRAMDIAEGDRGARILVVLSEITTVTFHGPHEDHIDTLIAQAMFGDGAGAAIIGADPDMLVENPSFWLIHGHQRTALTPTAPQAEILEMGQTIHLHKEIISPSFVSKNVTSCLLKTLEPLGIVDWDSLFWIANNGGPKVFDEIESELGLGKEKLDVSRYIMSEYGNIGPVSILFMLDEMRTRSVEQGQETTGLGSEWGVVFGSGPGFTVEALVLQSVLIEGSTNIPEVGE